MRPITSASVAVLVVALFASLATAAGEHYGLDPGFPLQVEDTSPVKPGHGYFEEDDFWTSTHEHDDRFTFIPEIAFGVIQDVDFHIQSTILAGDADRAGSGDIQMNSQWEFLKEKDGAWWPAMAIEGNLAIPTGKGSDGADPGVQFLATKTIGQGPGYDELHLNALWTHNSVANPGQRSETYQWIIGYSRAINDKAFFLADIVREVSPTHHNESNYAEVGVVQEFGEHAKFAAGVGAGFGDESPSFLVSLGFQWAF